VATNTRTLRVNIVGDHRNLQRTFDSIERSTGKLSRGFSRFGGVAVAALGMIGGAAVVGQVKAFIDSASNLNETVSKSNVIFGRNAREVQKWSRTTAVSIGLSREESLSAAAGFGDMFHQLKIGLDPATRMSKKMVTLAADFASFHNADISDVLQAQSAAFRGEFDSLQRFIPAINAARVQQEALSLTHKKSVKDLTDADKAMAVYQIMLKDTTAAQGDFGRTAGGAANQQRILAAQMKDLKATVGQALLPAFTAIVSKINEEFIPALKSWWSEHGPKVERAVRRVGEFFGELGGQLGKVKTAWDDNKDAFTALIKTFAQSDVQMGSTKSQAEQIADALVQVTEAAGRVARGMKATGEQLSKLEDGLSNAGKEIHDHFVVPFIDGIRQVGNVTLTTFEKIMGVSATVAEALHLPQAKALRLAQQGIRDYRVFFNQQMDQLKNENVSITATPGFRFTSSFSKGDWVAARIAAGRMAAGGRITAGTGPTADDVPIMASRGETVVSAKHSARPEFQAWASQVGIPGFATGGQVGVRPTLRVGKLPPEIGQFNGATQGIARIMGNWTGRILDAALKKLVSGNAAIKRFIRSTDPLPYIWGGAGPGGYDCSGIVSAVLGKMTGKGGGHGQRYFTTGSIRPGILGLKSGLGGVLQIGVTPSRGHMVGRYGGLGFEAESTRTGIKIGAAASRPEGFARHYHLAGGGRIDESFATLTELLARKGIGVGGDPGKMRIGSFDRGGWLMPGTTVATNRTSRPERVLPPGASGGPLIGSVIIHAGPGMDERRLAQYTASEILTKLRSRGSGV
jgi:hypothetical protein